MINDDEEFDEIDLENGEKFSKNFNKNVNDVRNDAGHHLMQNDVGGDNFDTMANGVIASKIEKFSTIGNENDIANDDADDDVEDDVEDDVDDVSEDEKDDVDDADENEDNVDDDDDDDDDEEWGDLRKNCVDYLSEQSKLLLDLSASLPATLIGSKSAVLIDSKPALEISEHVKIQGNPLENNRKISLFSSNLREKRKERKKSDENTPKMTENENENINGEEGKVNEKERDNNNNGIGRNNKNDIRNGHININGENENDNENINVKLGHLETIENENENDIEIELKHADSKCKNSDELILIRHQIQSEIDAEVPHTENDKNKNFRKTRKTFDENKKVNFDEKVDFENDKNVTNVGNSKFYLSNEFRGQDQFNNSKRSSSVPNWIGFAEDHSTGINNSGKNKEARYGNCKNQNNSDYSSHLLVDKKLGFGVSRSANDLFSVTKNSYSPLPRRYTVDIGEAGNGNKGYYSGYGDVDLQRCEFFDSGKASRRGAFLLLMSARYPAWLRLAMKRSILSPLIACFAAATLYIIVKFYIVFIYLTKYKYTFHELSLVLLGAFGLRLIFAPVIYYAQYFFKRRKWLKTEGRKMVLIFGFSSCLCFLLVFHPWKWNYGAIQLCVSLVLFEIAIENILFELSRIFQLQHFLLNSVSKDLNLLEDIAHTISTFAIFFIQIFSGNLKALGVFEVECLFVGVLAGGCFLFSWLFYPGKAQLKLCQGRKQIVSNVSQIHRNMAYRIARAISSASNSSAANNVDGFEAEDLEAISSSEAIIKYKSIAGMRRLLFNPHFFWPLLARCARQSRVTFNTVFLLLFVQIFFISAHDFNENGYGIDVYVILCLILHTVFIKLLWGTVRTSGAVVLNSILTTVSVACGVLMLMFGRKYHLLGAVYFLAEKKAISRKKFAFVNFWLANCFEYLALALALALIGTTHLKEFIKFEPTVPFGERCETQPPMVQNGLADSMPRSAHNSTHFIAHLFADNGIDQTYRTSNYINVRNGVRTALNKEEYENFTRPNTLDNSMESSSNETQINSTTGEMKLIDWTTVIFTSTTVNSTNATVQKPVNDANDTDEPDGGKSLITTVSSAYDDWTPLSYHQCDDFLDVVFLIAVTFSLLSAGLELFAMRRYRRHFSPQSSNVML